MYEHCQEHSRSCGINKSIMTLDQSRIKGICLDKSQNAYSLFIKDL